MMLSTGGEDTSVQDYYDWDEFRDDDIPDYKTYANNQSADNELYTRPMVEIHFVPGRI
jgi:RNA polymerase sigma-54 factor